MTDAPSFGPALPPVATPAPNSLGATGGTNLDTSRLQSRANLEAAGKKFEAVFTGMMVKSMRSTHLAEDDLFGSKGLDTFKEMQDTQFAQNMADHAPLGIGKAMTDFLAKSQKALQPDVPPAGKTP